MPGFNNGISHRLTFLAPSNRERVSLVSQKIARWHRRAGYDLVKVSRQWVYPLEVELCLADHPAVRECAVLAFELSDRRMTLAAFVVRNDGGFDADEVRRGLQDYVKQKLAPHKYPRSVVFMSELPKTA